MRTFFGREKKLSWDSQLLSTPFASVCLSLHTDTVSYFICLLSKNVSLLLNSPDMNKRPYTSPDSDQPLKRINMTSIIIAVTDDELGADYVQEIKEEYSYICVPRKDDTKILTFLHKVMDEHTKASIKPTMVERDYTPATGHTPKDWDLFLDLHKQLKNILFAFLRSFNKEELTANRNAEDFEEFKAIRKFLTYWHTNGQLAIKHIDRLKKCHQIDVVRLETKISHITIPTQERLLLEAMVKGCETKANILFINSLVAKVLSNTITLLDETLETRSSLKSGPRPSGLS
jgi:hypothetical protein